MSQLLQIRDASAHSGKTRLFSEISFGLKPGTLSCLIGPNGAGKSSVLRALAGIQPLSSGLIDIEGEPLCNLSSTHRARKIGYLPQTRPLAWPIRVRDVIALGRFAYGANTNRLTSDDEIAIDRAIQACDLGRFVDRRTDTLSGGELSRVHVARVLAGETPVLLADEPLAALDPKHQLRVMSIIRDFTRNGGCALVVLHDMSLSANFADRLIWMKSGRVLKDGSVDETLSPTIIKVVFDVSARVTGREISLLHDTSSVSD